MAFTTPLFIAIGGLLKIPAGGIADYVFHKLHYSALTIVGFVVIFVGVLIMNAYSFNFICKEVKQEKEEEYEQEKEFLVNN